MNGKIRGQEVVDDEGRDNVQENSWVNHNHLSEKFGHFFCIAL
jgi:hypothetical protein